MEAILSQKKRSFSEKDGDFYDRIQKMSLTGALTTEELHDYHQWLKVTNDDRLWRERAREEGLAEGRAEGRAQGRTEGIAEGRAKGRAEGLEEGIAQGRTEGIAEGIAQGRTEGRTEGLAEGKAQGRTEGIAEGRAEGLQEGKWEMAEHLFRLGVDLDTISKASELSISDLKSRFNIH